jgi:hypothetical protein
MSNTSLFVIVIVSMLTASLAYTSLLQYSYSQQVQEDGEQLWTDSDHDLMIRFTYNPKIPIIDEPTELQFTVQRISNEEYWKDLDAHVLITDNTTGQFRNFRFNNITAPDGQFSVNYLFPGSGLFEVITRLSSPEVQALAGFDVVVPEK